MEKLFMEIKEKIITNEWIESKCRGNSGVGITLESLLNKEKENFELPDYKGIELKAKCSKKESYITLFSATPDSYLFEIKRLQKEYGYPDSELPQFKVLNLSVYAHRDVKLNNYYFKLYVDRTNKKIVLRIYNKKKELIDNMVSWSFGIIKEKLERRLSYLAFVHADRKFEHNVVYFKYRDIKFYKLSSFDKFLWLIENGMIRITFRIGVYKSGRRYGEIYDHGTCFCIEDCNISRLFDRIYLEDQGK